MTPEQATRQTRQAVALQSAAVGYAAAKAALDGYLGDHDADAFRALIEAWTQSCTALTAASVAYANHTQREAK